MKLRVGNQFDLWQKMKDEVKLHRFAGQFEEIPFKQYVQSPFGLVGKPNGKTRLILHLSFAFQEHESINYHTPKHLCTVKYQDVDYAVRACTRAGQGAFMAKADMKAAFRHLPIRPQGQKWVVMKAKNPWKDKVYYFVENVSPLAAQFHEATFRGCPMPLLSYLPNAQDPSQ